METSNTLSETINELRKMGYTEDFNLLTDCISASGSAVKLYPEDFVIDSHYRFEGPSDPADESVVYAISSLKNEMKGVLVNSYGIYSDELVDELVSKLKERH